MPFGAIAGGLATALGASTAVAGIAGAAGSLVGKSILSGNEEDARQSAVNAGMQGIDAATAEQRRQFDITQENQKPYLETGGRALTKLEQATNSNDNFNYEQSPDYQFLQEEGEKALDRAAAARGGFDSGGSYKDLLRFNNNLAKTDYSNAYNRYFTDRQDKLNRLATLADVGQTATQYIGNVGNNTAENIGALGIQAGNLQAQGIMSNQKNSNSFLTSAMNTIGNTVKDFNASQNRGFGFSSINQTPAPSAVNGNDFGGKNYGGSGSLLS